MTNQPLQRTSYRFDGTTTHIESRRDMDKYHRPLEAIHASNLHGPGIGAGLGVTASLNNQNLNVLPGVAIDSQGRHISLAEGGHAETAQDEASLGASPDTVKDVSADGVVFPTAVQHPDDYYLTIQFVELPDGDTLAQIPWIRLQKVSGYVVNGESIVLARVKLGANGTVTELTSHLRHGTDLPVESIHLRKSGTVTPPSGKNVAIGNVPSGEIRAVDGGLSITGNVGIGTTNPEARLQVQGNIAISQYPGKLMIGGTTDDFSVLKAETGKLTINEGQWAAVVIPSGNVGIGTATPQAKLQVTDGAIMPSAGNSEQSGLLFPRDPGGGGFDRAWMRYYPRNGEAMTLEIGIANDADDHLALMPSGNVGIGTVTPGARLDVEGGAFLGYETTLSSFNAPLKSGFYQDGGELIAGDVPDRAHTWTHLIAARHSNTANNHQLQIASSYTANDRLFFRKIQDDGTSGSSNPAWNEVATRGPNTFAGSQTISGDVTIDGSLRVNGAQNILKVETIVQSLQNGGPLIPRQWSVSYGGFAEIYCVFAVFQGFSLFPYEGNTNWGSHVPGPADRTFTQHAYVRVHDYDLNSARGEVFCSEANLRYEVDNTILFTVVVMGRGV